MKEMICYPHAFFENRIIPIEKARVSIMTNALQYGTGVFAGIRGYWNKQRHCLYIFRLNDHMDRFFKSLHILGTIIPYSKDTLRDIIGRLTKKNKPHENVYFRPFAYASSVKLAPNLARDREFAFALYMIPLEDYLPTDKGLSVRISSWRRISDNAIPARCKATGAYINSALIRKEAVDDGYDEAIVLTQSGEVAEGSAENIFIVRGNTLITPPVSADIVEGITRQTVIELAHEHHVSTVERSIDRTELYVADEAFFSGTGVQIAWINSIDKRLIGRGNIGRITKLLRDSYFEITRGLSTQHAEWRTEIHLR